MVVLLLDWLWLVVALAGFICVSCSVVYKLDFCAVFWFVVTLILIQFLCKINVWGYFCEHWVQVLLWTLVYLPIGVIWSFTKWFVFLRGIKLKYQDKLERFMQLRNLVNTYEAVETADWRLALNSYENDDIRKPKVEDHKEDIIRWVVYWPFSIATTIVGDFVKHIVREIYAKVAHLYSKMVEKVLGDLY